MTTPPRRVIHSHLCRAWSKDVAARLHLHDAALTVIHLLLGLKNKKKKNQLNWFNFNYLQLAHFHLFRVNLRHNRVTLLSSSDFFFFLGCLHLRASSSNLQPPSSSSTLFPLFFFYLFLIFNTHTHIQSRFLIKIFLPY